MKKSRLLCILLSTCLLVHFQPLHAGVIAQAALADASTQYDGLIVGAPGVLQIIHGGPAGTAATFQEPLTEASAGSSFLYDSGAQFASAVSLMTDGVDGHICAASQPGGATCPFESNLFAGSSLNGIDLAGYTITGVEWNIDAYSILYSARPDGSDVSRVDFSSSLTIYGVSPVPIPPALWLFGSGLLGLIGVARKKPN